MSDKVGLMLRISPLTRHLISQCAELDFRTISAYVEAYVHADAVAKKLIDDDPRAWADFNRDLSENQRPA